MVTTTVVISKVGDEKDFFVELTNNANSDIDISNWFLKSNGKTFVLPKNSIILSKKQMTISGKITNFNLNDKYGLKLFSGSNELIYDYNFSNQKKVFQANSAGNVENKNNIQTKEMNLSEINSQEETNSFTSGLEASPVLSNLE